MQTDALITPWHSPPLKPILASGQVHLWRFRIDLAPENLAALRPLLQQDELMRVRRLLDPAKADRFVAGRGRLRQILARYLDLTPGAIDFAYGVHGKPKLAQKTDRDLTFNLSHAGRWGLLAVTSGRAVGVDIENIDPGLNYEKIAARILTSVEAARLSGGPLVRRRRIFFRMWTRKEALLKGQGGGFSTPATIRSEAGWWVRSFAVDRRYLGALAVAGEAVELLRWTLGQDSGHWAEQATPEKNGKTY